MNSEGAVPRLDGGEHLCRQPAGPTSFGCDFHCEEIWQFLKTEFLRQRKRIITSEIIAGTGSNSMNWLSQFIKSFNGQCRVDPPTSPPVARSPGCFHLPA
jgi:hypothetical protein